MYWLKGCSKCGGDLYLAKDRFGSVVSCFQCGAVRLDFEDSKSLGAVSAVTEAHRAPAQQEPAA
jgi:hypothetical protein